MLGSNIENEMYAEPELTEANNLMAAVTSSVSSDLNAATIESVSDDIKNFLGI